MLLGHLTADGNGYSVAMFCSGAYVLLTLGTFGMIMVLNGLDRLTVYYPVTIGEDLKFN